MYAMTIAAANLKAAAPDQFEGLVEAFRLLESKYRDDYLAADANVIFNAQGRAWLAAQLRTRLEKCFEQRRTYEQRG